MNRFQHDNIEPQPSPARRKAVLEQKCGIGQRGKKRVKGQSAKKAGKDSK